MKAGAARIVITPPVGVELSGNAFGPSVGILGDLEAQALVLDVGGEVIDGLYAIGNCSAPVTGSTYPASGATLGSAMVFGYIAGAEAAAGNFNVEDDVRILTPSASEARV